MCQEACSFPLGWEECFRNSSREMRVDSCLVINDSKSISLQIYRTNSQHIWYRGRAINMHRWILDWMNRTKTNEPILDQVAKTRFWIRDLSIANDFSSKRYFHSFHKFFLDGRPINMHRWILDWMNRSWIKTPMIANEPILDFEFEIRYKQLMVFPSKGISIPFS